jgi:casein kinase II subunit alpha
MSGRAVQRDKPTYNINTISKVYAEINKKLGLEWYDYENWMMPNSSPDPYEIVDRIGSGKYSDVFTAYKGKKIVAVKVLKPVRASKYSKEAKILVNLKDCPNIVKLFDVVQNPFSLQYSFVFEYCPKICYKELIPVITDYECRLYFYQLINALHYAHSHGIMHRDVKPGNVCFDRKTEKLRLIDWGLAEFYMPGENYNIHVSTLSYKPPELLLDYQKYDYSIDIWSFGVTLASFVFKKIPFFYATSDCDMVTKIASVLGGQNLREYMDKYGLPMPPTLQNSMIRPRAKPWWSFITPDNSNLANDDAIDLIGKCVRYDHMERITAKEAMNHPYFDPVRDFVFS